MLTQEKAKEWLIKHDPEGALFWSEQPYDTDFIQAVYDNIRDFGPCDELGDIERYQLSVVSIKTV